MCNGGSEGLSGRLINFGMRETDAYISVWTKVRSSTFTWQRHSSCPLAYSIRTVEHVTTSRSFRLPVKIAVGMAAPFHRLLAWYSNKSDSPNTQTIRLTDSLRGNLALGLDFPVALAVAVGRHLYFRNTGIFSLGIHVPSVSTKKTLLDGIPIDEKKEYTRAEIVGAAKPNGVLGQIDAIGLWALASDVRSGLLHGEDVVAFQQGTLFDRLERRRLGRDHVLPFYRGGPIS